MKTKTALPSTIQIKGTIIADLEDGRYPEADSDYRNFFDLTLRFYTKLTTSDKNVIFKQIRGKYMRRCSSQNESIISNELRDAMREVNASWARNQSTIETKALLERQASKRCKEEISHGDPTDIFPLSYLQRFFPNELKVATQ